MGREVHEIQPVYNRESRILILGSFPSVKSRESMFFYGHPQNRFWKVIAAVLEKDIPNTIEEKKRLLIENHIALWDVIASCDVEGSADSSIRDVVPNNLGIILETANIRHIYCNGGKSYELYTKYCEPVTGRKAVKLPSTSPANAACNLDKLIAQWKIIREPSAFE